MCAVRRGCCVDRCPGGAMKSRWDGTVLQIECVAGKYRVRVEARMGEVSMLHQKLRSHSTLVIKNFARKNVVFEKQWRKRDFIKASPCHHV